MRQTIGIIFLLLFFIAPQSAVAKESELSEKKREFFKKVVPAIEKVYNQQLHIYKIVKELMHQKRRRKVIEALKKLYHVKSDKELLCALKPHPKSIAIAQAAIESAWGTSRFFREANNIFGVWSSNPKEPRIAARSKRGRRTIWLRKFSSLEDSVRSYYFLLSSKRAYRRFRQLNCNEKNSVYRIAQGLRSYSERGQAYVNSIISVIRHNKLTRYDTEVAKKSL
jgi:Bax protein